MDKQMIAFAVFPSVSEPEGRHVSCGRKPVQAQRFIPEPVFPL